MFLIERYYVSIRSNAWYLLRTVKLSIYRFTTHLSLEFREAFELFDKDGSGYINSRELLTVMRAFKQDPTKAEVQHLMQELDTNGIVRLS